MIMGFRNRTSGEIAMAYRSTKLPMSHNLEVSAGNIHDTTQTVHFYFILYSVLKLIRYLFLKNKYNPNIFE